MFKEIAYLNEIVTHYVFFEFQCTHLNRNIYTNTFFELHQTDTMNF